MSTDTMLSQLLAFPPQPPPASPITDKQYDSGVRSVLKALEGLGPGRLAAPVTGDDTLLDVIEPSTNPIPYLYALLAQARATKEPGGIGLGTKLWAHMIVFVNSFDPIQVRYCGQEFRRLLELVYKGASSDPILAIEPITVAMLRIDPTGSTLTSTHLLLVETCLREKAYALALPILDKDIYHLPGPPGTEYSYPSLLCDSEAISANYVNVKSGLTQPITYQDYLKYFLYGASIYIACKQWRRALSFLEIVVVSPGFQNAISMIQIEAFKKWCLVSILVHGRLGHSPRNLTQFALKQYQNVAKAYTVLGDIFNQRDTKRLQAEIEAGPFRLDCNYTLALLVLIAHYRFAILELARTYVRLPLRLIPALVSRPADTAAETKAYVEELITSGQLHASLTHPVGSETPDDMILDFTASSAAEQSEEELLAAHMDQRRRLAVLQERINEAQRRMELSKEYVAAAKRARKQEATRKESGLDEDDTMADEL